VSDAVKNASIRYQIPHRIESIQIQGVREVFKLGVSQAVGVDFEKSSAVHRPAVVSAAIKRAANQRQTRLRHSSFVDGSGERVQHLKAGAVCVHFEDRAAGGAV
jgi:hypothetical protein